MSELLLLGTSHKTAPLAVRERVALSTRGWTSDSAIRTAMKLSGTNAPATIANTDA